MSSGKWAVAVALLSVPLILTGCDLWSTQAKDEAPDIPFAAMEDPAVRDPDNPINRFRVDMAMVESAFPLSREDRMAITPENIQRLSQEQIDQIYGRITAGPIPDGIHRGDLFFARDEQTNLFSRDRKTRLGAIIGGIPGRALDEKIEAVEKLGRRLWKGKVFFRDQGILRNMIQDYKLLDIAIDEEDTIPTVKIPRGGILGRILPSDTVSLLFPAKLYCGQSLLDSRRESVIVDYFYSEDIEGYRKSPDSLAGRGGLKIRDEIRMIRPGFYLGRAYTNKVFLLNFTLYNAEIAQGESEAFLAGNALAEDCWTGEQRQAAVK